MTRNEKKAVIESMAEKFMNIDDLEGKSMTIMRNQRQRPERTPSSQKHSRMNSTS